MNEETRKAHNANKLTECWPSFALKVTAVLRDLEGHGLRPRIQCAWRSPADQIKAYREGHSKLKFGYHNVTGSGGHPEALACDILDDDHPNQESTQFLLMLAASAKAHGLTTGIRWSLPTKLRTAIDQAIADKAWNRPIKVGWDPCHTETTSVSVAQAKNGQRP